MNQLRVVAAVSGCCFGSMILLGAPLHFAFLLSAFHQVVISHSAGRLDYFNFLKFSFGRHAAFETGHYRTIMEDTASLNALRFILLIMLPVLQYSGASNLLPWFICFFHGQQRTSDICHPAKVLLCCLYYLVAAY